MTVILIILALIVCIPLKALSELGEGKVGVGCVVAFVLLVYMIVVSM